MKTIDTLATTSTSVTISVSGLGLILIKVSTKIACGITLPIKVSIESILDNYNKDKEYYERSQQNIYSFFNFIENTNKTM